MSDYYLHPAALSLVHSPDVTLREPYRPVVVIDPEDREQVERLLSGYAGWKQCGESPADYPHYVDDMQAALREFANPTPPKPDEPTGLGAVVEDEDGHRWVRAGKSHGGRLEDNWRGVDGGIHGGWWSKYADIKAVRVLSEGVAR